MKEFTLQPTVPIYELIYHRKCQSAYYADRRTPTLPRALLVLGCCIVGVNLCLLKALGV